MELVVIFLLLALCLLAPIYGVDSRTHDDRDRRPWWAATPR
jgi:hypothetical protein